MVATLRLAKLFFLFALPAIIWNAPLQSSQIQEQHSCSIHPCNEQYFTFDEIIALIESFENGTLENYCSEEDLNAISDFIVQLARSGTSTIDPIDSLLLKHDIDELYAEAEDLHYFYSYNSKQLSQILPEKTHKQYEIIPCRSFKQRWKSCKKFCHKHKKAIIIGAVIVVATVAIIVTQGAAAPAAIPAIAGASSSDRTPVNKPGEVRIQQKDDESQQPSLTPINDQAFKEIIKEQTPIIKETLSEQIPEQPLNLSPQEEDTFWRKVGDTISMLSHQTVESPSNTLDAPIEQSTLDAYHENIDNYFGTNYADLFTPEAKEAQPGITVGILPPPTALGETARKVATLARSSKTLAGTAAAASALSKPTPPHPNTETSQGHNNLQYEFTLDELPKAGKQHDREGLTKAGRALQKHGGRPNSNYPKPSGTITEVNAQGQKILEEILSHPDKTIIEDYKPRFGNVIDIVVPGTGGVRFTSDGKEMICFLEP
ncbi:MAG: hypothetical protein KFB93_01485 [Simkaniaceae bacterium]|nr:MAG: hypothetical protein KFB93_01485 [Simkaniaceae bacterium]